MSGMITAVAGATLLGTVASGYMQSNAAEDAANIQAGSANQANQLQYQMFQEQQKLMQPWAQSGGQNLDRLNYAMYGQVPTREGALPANQMGVAPGGLNPDWRFSTQDWKNSPEYSVYAGARDAAINKSQDALMAQNAASGMYGSGTMANQLSQNMGQLYAQYDPQSLAAAQSNAIGARQNEYNMLTGMSSPTGAQQVAQYAGQYGQNAGQNIVGAGNAQAAGQVGAANAWGNALTSGTNQIANAYGQYQGQQNFNQMAQMYGMGGGYNPNVGAPGAYGAPVQSGGGTFYGNTPQY